MQTDLWMAFSTQASAPLLATALAYLDARLTLQANGGSVLAANCLQACGKGRRGDLALLAQAAAVRAPAISGLTGVSLRWATAAVGAILGLSGAVI